MVRHTGEDFIDVEGIAVTPVLPLQSSDIERAELDAPETNRFSADSDASFSQKIFDIPGTEVESVVQPDGVADDVWWEPVTLVCIHHRIVSFRRVNLAIPFVGIHLAILSISAR